MPGVAGTDADKRRIHGTKSRLRAGCVCEICLAAKPYIEWGTIRKRVNAKERFTAEGVGMTDIGWIVLQIQRMAEDKSVPAAKRARAREWYHRLTYADSAPATSIVAESGGRRRSHNARRQVATDMQWHGPSKRPLIET